METNLESKMKKWLQVVLTKETWDTFSIKILENSEDHSTHGEIVFVDVHGNTKDRLEKEYNIALKCSRKNKILRSQSPVKELFLKEIDFYEQIMPAFVHFEKERGVENYFDNIPKYYGKFIDDSVEVLVFENLRKQGYVLWDKKKALTIKHVNLVINAYGRFHAVSVAMNDQQPEKFSVFKELLANKSEKLNNQSEELIKILLKSVDDVSTVLRNELDQNILQKWHSLKHYIASLSLGSVDTKSRLKVITHGDCWSNNFMYLCNNNEMEIPKKVTILDFQRSRYSTPITDLSYFLFSCISEEDLPVLKIIFKYYYKSFAQHLEKLGTQASTLYPFDEFLSDWKNYCKYGIILASLIHKICTVEKEEIVNFTEVAEYEKTSSALAYKIKSNENFKNRIRPIVKYVVEQDLV